MKLKKILSVAIAFAVAIMMMTTTYASRQWNGDFTIIRNNMGRNTIEASFASIKEAPDVLYAKNWCEVKAHQNLFEMPLVLWSFNENEKVECVGTSRHVYLVKTENGIGYVENSALTSVPPPTPEPTPEPTPDPTPEPESELETDFSQDNMEYLGTFLVTRYCRCEICNGEWTGEPTAIGTELTDGRTIAVDPSVIPLGTHVYIEGIGERIAEDTGSAINGNDIDLFCDISHDEIMDEGVTYNDVYIIN